MATEPHTHPEHQQQQPVREREVIVTNDGGSRRSGMSGVVVAVLAIIVIAIVGVLVVNAIGGATGGEGPSVEVPSEVNIDTGSGGGGS
jgi:hypothetical protein